MGLYKLLLCRTDIRTTPTLDTKIDLELFKLLEIVVGGCGLHQKRHKINRASFDTISTAYAGGFGIIGGFVSF